MPYSEIMETQAMCNLNKRAADVFMNTFLLGKRCFIIAGGPSLKDRFDFSSLKGENTIGMNMTFERFPTTICHFRDDDLYQNIVTGYLDRKHNDCVRSKFEKFKGIKVFLAQPARIIYGYNCYVVNRLYKETISHDIATGIYPGNNSTFSSMMLAISLGCKEIYLIGADMKVTTQTHWHQRYEHEVKQFAERCKVFKKEMDEWAPRFLADGIEVTQLVMDSANETSLTCFPIKTLKEIGI